MWSPTSDILATGSGDSSVRLWKSQDDSTALVPGSVMTHSLLSQGTNDITSLSWSVPLSLSPSLSLVLRGVSRLGFLQRRSQNLVEFWNCPFQPSLVRSPGLRRFLRSFVEPPARHRRSALVFHLLLAGRSLAGARNRRGEDQRARAQRRRRI